MDNKRRFGIVERDILKVLGQENLDLLGGVEAIELWDCGLLLMEKKSDYSDKNAMKFVQ